MLTDATERRELAAEIAMVLSGIREAYPEMTKIELQKPDGHEVGLLALRLAPWLFEAVALLVENQTGPILLRTGHVAFDALNERLGLSAVSTDSLYFWNGNVMFHFDVYLDLRAASEMYREIEGVEYVDYVHIHRERAGFEYQTLST